MTTVLRATPESMRVTEDDGLCALCAAPATLEIWHRCGQQGAGACLACWQGHLARCRELAEANPDKLGMCSYCCNPDDPTATVTMDHVYAVPKKNGTSRFQHLDVQK